MKSSNEKDAIIEKINLLQIKQAEELLDLKGHLHSLSESLKPMNLIRNTFLDMTSSTEVKSDLMNGALNLASGFISKKVLFGAVEKPIKKLLINGLQFILGKLSSKKE